MGRRTDGRAARDLAVRARARVGRLPAATTRMAARCSSVLNVATKGQRPRLAGYAAVSIKDALIATMTMIPTGLVRSLTRDEARDERFLPWQACTGRLRHSAQQNRSKRRCIDSSRRAISDMGPAPQW